mgnify:CR=1 FL=1
MPGHGILKMDMKATACYRDEVLHMNPEDRGFVDKLYKVYGMQGYLQTYARRLMQATLKEGKSSYQQKVPVLYYIPSMIMAYSIVMIITVICLTKLLSNTLINPMVRLAHCSRKIARNDFSGNDVTVENKDEMGELVQAFNKMKHATEGHINTLKEKNEIAERLHKEELGRIEMEKRLDAARLELLKSQINPHFLFNTLNTLKWIATLNHVTPVSHGIDALSSLLQSTLIKKDELIPFDDELRNLKNYCDIQQLRYAGRFEMEYQIEDAAGYWTVPRFILQPLVENSILHGTADEDDFVTITVRATVSENLLTIHISDTGCGFDPSAIKEKNSERFSGIGLSNVDERMRLHYGNEYGLTIESAPGTGTQCILRIPNEAIR